MEGLSARLASLRVSRLAAALLLVLCFALGYLAAAWWVGPHDTTALMQICSRVDYINTWRASRPRARKCANNSRRWSMSVVRR